MLVPSFETDWGESCVTTEVNFNAIKKLSRDDLLVIVYAECLPIRFHLFSITQDFKNKFCYRSVHDQESLRMAKSANGADCGAYCSFIFVQPGRVWGVLHSTGTWTT